MEQAATPLKWSFKFAGKKHDASFVDGKFKTSLPVASSALRITIDNKIPVRLGFLGPIMQSSLDAPDVAKATITYVIGLISDPDSMEAPALDSYAEPDFSQVLPNNQ